MTTIARPETDGLFAGLLPDPEPEPTQPRRSGAFVDPPDRARRSWRRPQPEPRPSAPQPRRGRPPVDRDDPVELLALLERVVAAHRTDADVVHAAILRDGLAHGGVVDPNRVRRALASEDGEIAVHPQTLSAQYSALRARGVIEYRGPAYDVPNEDRYSNNTGKTTRTYRLLGYRSAR